MSATRTTRSRIHRPSAVRLGALAVVLAVVPLITDNNYHLRLVSLFAIWAVLAASLNLIYGYAGQISVGQTGFYGLGAYGTALTMTRLGAAFWVAWLGAMALTGMIAWLIGKPALRLRHLYFAVATLGFGAVVHVLANRWLALTHGPTGVIGIGRPELPGGPLITEASFYYFATVFLVVALAAVHLVVRSPFGLVLTALREGEIPVNALGIDTARAKLRAFVMSAVLAGAAGGVFATLTQYVGPGSFTAHHSIVLLAVVVIGGLGRESGPLLAAGLLLVLNELSRAAGDWQHVISSAALLAAVMYMPEGIAGVLSAGGRRLLRWLPWGAPESRVDPRLDRRPASPPDQPGQAGQAAAQPSAGPVLPLLEVEGLTCRYEGFTALDDFSMRVRPGELVGFIGPNGAGKTTFINAVTGLTPHAKGTVAFSGHDIGKLRPHATAALGLGRTFQTTKLFGRLTVAENVLLGAQARRQASGDRPGIGGRSPREWLEVVGLADAVDRPAGSLPFGQRRLLELARALCAGPQLLLLDEPAAGLNEAETQRLGELLLRLREEGLTLVLVEHDLSLVLGVSDRVVALAFGKKIGEGTPAEITQDEAVIAAYLGTKSTRPVESKSPTLPS